MFLLVSVRHVGAHPDGHQHDVSIKSSINLGNRFLRISRIRNIPLTWILAMVCTFTSFHFPDSGLYLLNGFDFYFDLFWMAWHWKPAIRSPGKFSRPFIRPCKKNRSLLASLLNNGRVSFPKFPNPPPFHRHWQISSIRHLHISHNALFCLPNFA